MFGADGRTRTVLGIMTSNQPATPAKTGSTVPLKTKNASNLRGSLDANSATLPCFRPLAPKTKKGAVPQDSPFLCFWCRWPDSNRHSSRHCPLKTACLPIPPHRLNLDLLLRNRVGAWLRCRARLVTIKRRHALIVYCWLSTLFQGRKLCSGVFDWCSLWSDLPGF